MPNPVKSSTTWLSRAVFLLTALAEREHGHKGRTSHHGCMSWFFFFYCGTFRENKTAAFRTRWMCHFYSQRTATSCKKIPRTEALLFMVLIWATYQGHFFSLTTPHCTAESSVLLFPSHLWSRAHYCHQHFSFPHTWHPAGQQHKGNTDVKR